MALYSLSVLFSNGAAALEPHRELEGCEKCSGSAACSGVADMSKIGCGSCMGVWACNNLASDVTIGAGSCTGDYACYYGKGEWNIVSVG